MSAKKKIIFTGGSTAGHITPNIPLIAAFQEIGWETHCIILGNTMERSLLEPTHATLHTIPAGKLRRYIDIQNITDIMRTIRGCFAAMRIIRTVRPNAIFSKGGYIAVPVALAAWLYHVPFFIHESDTIPSLTTKITSFIARAVFSGFPVEAGHEWKGFTGPIRRIYAGIPLRREFMNVSEQRLPPEHGTVLVIGGSLGATTINTTVRAALPLLLRDFNVVHVCGAGKTVASEHDAAAYRQYEFVNTADMHQLMNEADVVITRGGATFLYELMAQRKPILIIPLSRKASRGDQIANAAFITSHGLGESLDEDVLTPERLSEKVHALYESAETYRTALAALPLPDSTQIIKETILRAITSVDTSTR